MKPKAAPKRKSVARRRTPVPVPEPSGAFPIVGIGASAGGLEAMTLLLKELRPDPGLALVLVQHLDPTHESALAAILARATAMPVLEAKNGTRVAPNHLYVIPPKMQMEISGRRLRLSPIDKRDGPRAVDRFLTSLADEEGTRAIGVVLSGNGSDGTLGLRAVKAAGGVTLAQDQGTAKYGSMPASAVDAGCVDLVLPPGRLARELQRLAGDPYLRPGPEAEGEPIPHQSAFEEILTIVRKGTGVDFSLYKHTTLRRRIQRRMMLQKKESAEAYAAFLLARPSEVKELYQDFLIHVTGFFRDPMVFQALRKTLGPRLLRDKAPDEPLRIWVPGCSTGEEVYSIAMTLLMVLSERRRHHPLQLFGTDINDAALETARAGLYPESIRDHVPADRLRRFFAKVEGGYRIQKSVRELCVFARQNVVADPPFSGIDLISCRNVLIYLGQALQRKVFPLFHYALRKDGVLLLGASETIGSHVDLFALLDGKAKAYVRKVAPGHAMLAFSRSFPEPAAARPTTPAASPGFAPPTVADVQQQADRLVLTEYGPAGVVVTRHLDVVQFRGRTAPFLEHAHGEASLNLLRMAKEGLALDLRATIGRAIKENARVRLESTRFKDGGRPFEASIEVLPFSVPPSAERYYLVLFQRLPEAPAAPGRGQKGAAARAPSDDARLVRLDGELAATRASLQAIIEEHEVTNEELRSANEEITSSNEELQSTNEEVETAKEELQSTNEELTTLNDELESRNSQLEGANNDLKNLLASVNIPIVILGRDLRIRRFTTVAERTLHLIPADAGRPITDLNLPITIPDLPRIVNEVIEGLAPREIEVKCSRGRWWSVRFRPYKTTDNRIDGAVIAILDIDALKAGALDVAPTRALADALAASSRDPLVLLDDRLSVRLVNPAFCATFWTSPDQVVGRRVFELSDGGWDGLGLRNLLEQALPRDGQAAECEVDLELPHGGPQTFRASAVRLPGDVPEAAFVLLTLREAARGEGVPGRPG